MEDGFDCFDPKHEPVTPVNIPLQDQIEYGPPSET